MRIMKKFSMPGKLLFIAVIFFVISICFSQEQPRRPTFPEVFQTQVEGTFIEGDGVKEVDMSMFFDRPRNRAALFITKEGETMKFIYDFDKDESLSIDDNNCDVDKIPDEPGFFPFKVINGKKKMSKAEEALFFTKSVADKPTLTPGEIPVLVYRVNIAIPQYGQPSCDIIHVFSKPDFQQSTCKDGIYCESTLISLSVKCRSKENFVDVDHVYKFSRFRREVIDESVFLPPPGIYCGLKTSMELPKFPPYFSFTFDMTEKMSPDAKTVFNTHKEIWYDSVYKIIRIDEYGANGLLYSSKIFDLKAAVAFTIIASDPTCTIGPISEAVKLDEVTRLPKSFFNINDSSVYVGKRKVHGLYYDVWSRMWTDSDSAARIVEDVYYLQIEPSQDISTKTSKVQPYAQLSHVDMYTYEMEEERFELEMLKHYAINNYRSMPKEWAAFDVATCFDLAHTKPFSLKVKGVPLVAGSQSYRRVLELLYNKIITFTDVSLVRISELRGVFDGINLVEIKGSIIDNAVSTGWPEGSKEPGMEETFRLIKRAASNNQLSVSLLDENNKKLTIKVTFVEETQNPADGISDDPTSCYSGGSLAAASLVLLIIGIFFGVAGYYVFLKKRRTPSNVHVKMSDLKG